LADILFLFLKSHQQFLHMVRLDFNILQVSLWEHKGADWYIKAYGRVEFVIIVFLI